MLKFLSLKYLKLNFNYLKGLKNSLPGIDKYELLKSLIINLKIKWNHRLKTNFQI